MKVTRICPACKKPFEVERGAANRAKARGYRPRCGMICSGIMRQDDRTIEAKRKAKAAYDREYRAQNLRAIKDKKAEYCKTPEGRAMQKENRKRMRAYHLAYLKRPEQRAKERQRRYVRVYGPLAEVAKAIHEIRQEVWQRVPDKYDRYRERGYFARQSERQRQRRQYAKERQCKT